MSYSEFSLSVTSLSLVHTSIFYLSVKFPGQANQNVTRWLEATRISSIRERSVGKEKLLPKDWDTVRIFVAGYNITPFVAQSPFSSFVKPQDRIRWSHSGFQPLPSCSWSPQCVPYYQLERQLLKSQKVKLISNATQWKNKYETPGYQF